MTHRPFALLAANAALILAGASSALAQILPESLRACASEADDTRRLACYDREVGRPQQAAGAGPRASESPASASKLTPEQRFGMSGEMERKVRGEDEGERLDRISAKVTRVAKRPLGEKVLTLDNGQVWVEKKPSDYFPVEAGDTVTIRTGAFGSYWVSLPSKRSTQVTRIK